MSKAAKPEGELYSEQPLSEIAKRHSMRDAKFDGERAGTESRYSETLSFRSTEVESRHRIPASVAERAPHWVSRASPRQGRKMSKTIFRRALFALAI